MEKSLNIRGPGAVVVALLLLAFMGLRVTLFADSKDPALLEAVRQELWSSYSGQLGVEIESIRSSGDYSPVGSLVRRASPDAITIEQVSRSEPLLEWSSNQDVVVRVRYRLPEEKELRTGYMRFTHGGLNGWRYRYDSTALSYYLNFL